MAFQARQADHYNRLAKVGREGFALLEELEFIRPPKKFGNGHQPPQAHDFHYHPQHYNNYQYEHLQPAYYRNGHQPHQAHDFHHHPRHYNNYQYESVIDSNQAAQLYGGKVVVDHSILRKPIPNGGY
ncbi:hypothetical protein Pint_24454 [Pistacia integerrima]|uniref:Uncharacterized protein n=1 Tax=Pistacia integerrima TaxID=434235 RepID=A0ACC0YD27_9ROSI|nr:hypothetical protein Pint_24454 [Pistacia integerrima]